MSNLSELLKSLRQYKDKADAFHYMADKKYNSVEETCEGLSSLRKLCEIELPKLAVAANRLSEDECKELFSPNQQINIDQYGLKLFIFSLLVSASFEVRSAYNIFRETVEIT